MNQQDSALELTVVERQTGAEPGFSVIWMHGLGADANDFVPAVPAMAPGSDRPVRFIFPNAPMRPVTINGGAVMRAWFDILGLDMESRVDDAGIRASAAAIDRLVQREIERGIPAQRIVLAGFSQGGAVALFTALRHPHRLAGVLALSTYLPLNTGEFAQPANRDIPIFMAHGRMDGVLPLALGEMSRDRLVEQGYPVSWKTYAMEHAVCPEELQDIRRFLAERFDASIGP